MEKAIEFSLKAKKMRFQGGRIRCSADAWKYAKKLYKDDMLIYETAYIILVNRNNDIIGHAKLSQGGIGATVIDIQLACKYALEVLASGMVLVHNHPSGQLMASKEDRNVTEKLRAALDTLNIRLYDSIIITEDSYLSFCDEGDL